ncbi:unnamed protein product [Sphagnum troendelagicum]|uniref:Uncharacterized protein n=1 Tax=Sphagnum troendelagicum TaxID=128251 RepID=A0ABP0U6D9_9BRYO
MLRPARSTSSFEVGLWHFSFLCAFSRALKRRRKIGAAPAGVVDAFLKELEIIELPGKQLAGSLARERRRRSCRVYVQYLGVFSEEVAESCRSMRFSEEVWPEGQRVRHLAGTARAEDRGESACGRRAREFSLES